MMLFEINDSLAAAQFHSKNPLRLLAGLRAVSWAPA
jgi:hypothetical protein